MENKADDFHEGIAAIVLKKLTDDRTPTICKYCDRVIANCRPLQKACDTNHGDPDFVCQIKYRPQCEIDRARGD